jgi:hypothetical protein
MLIGRPRRRRGRGEDGAAAVEFAIVVPVLLLLVIGMLEFAFVMRDYLSVSSSVRVGVRIAATGAGAGPGTCPGLPVICTPGNTPALAQAAADAIQQAGTAMPQDFIQYVWVYQANTDGFPGSATTQAQADAAGCATVANCVVFKWNKTLNRFLYDGGTWVSSTINACLNSPNAQSVGVFMRANHPYLSRLFGSSISLTDRAVMKFEPLATRECNGLGVGNGGHI